jgi:gliding motility-associated-like protein
LFHIRGGLLPSQDVTIQVRAIGACGNSVGTVTAKSLPEKIFVPNTFSPNGDGLNDRLLAYGYGVQTMQFMVFNQWGEKVFETSSQTSGWDGTYKGKAQPSGVYMYVLRATLTDGTKVDMKGSINLIR